MCMVGTAATRRGAALWYRMGYVTMPTGYCAWPGKAWRSLRVAHGIACALSGLRTPGRLRSDGGRRDFPVALGDPCPLAPLPVDWLFSPCLGLLYSARGRQGWWGGAESTLDASRTRPDLARLAGLSAASAAGAARFACAEVWVASERCRHVSKSFLPRGSKS